MAAWSFAWPIRGPLLAPIVKRKTYRVRRNETRDVGVTVPVTQEQIDAIQSLPYDAQCTTKATIIDTFGTTPYEDS